MACGERRTPLGAPPRARACAPGSMLAGVMLFAAGVSRDMIGSYAPSFLLAGILHRVMTKVRGHVDIGTGFGGSCDERIPRTTANRYLLNDLFVIAGYPNSGCGRWQNFCNQASEFAELHRGRKFANSAVTD